MIPLAAGCLLVPSFFISVWIERRICLRYWRHLEAQSVNLHVRRANLVSYTCLFALAIAGAIVGAVRR
jgi:hypothetical protein